MSMFSMNPRDLKRAMRRLGIDVRELEGVRSVTITLEDKELIIRAPQVIVMKAQGQKIYQIMGGKEEVLERAPEIKEVKFSEEDIRFVMEQTGVSRDEAIKALEEANGDIAQAILLLTSGE